MTSESQLREQLRKIEALFAGAGTAGERLAAKAALQRCMPGSRNWLAPIRRSSSNCHFLTNSRGSFSWHFAAGTGGGRFVIANTVMIRALRGFVDNVLRPESSWRGRCKSICSR